ncbi:MAG TPA: single-stranded DNA-binding protein [Chloroflexi bacterium]|jgi:single-strand DNA-binding protein|nr:single-stranded DNA-binding protein [Chloroflexota bacterium]
MAGINKVIIVGNLGRDPEMRYTPSGAAVTSFSVAVSRNWKSAEGESREETEWFNVECWNKLAEITNQYLSKGKQVYIEGRQRTESWDDKNTGEKRYRTKLVASEMQMLGSRGDQGSAPPPSGDEFTAAATPAGDDLDTMPF